jgi:hypothetical protein
MPAHHVAALDGPAISEEGHEVVLHAEEPVSGIALRHDVNARGSRRA